MAQNANVRSIDSIDAFRSNLIVYIEKSCAVLDEVSDEAKRLRMWLQNQRKQELLTLLRKKQRHLENLQQELFSDQLQDPDKSHTVQEMAIRKTKREVMDIEEKLWKLKHWLKVFDSEVAPLVKDVDKLKDLIDTDLAKGVATLNKIITTLQEYAEMTISQEAETTGVASGPVESEDRQTNDDA